METSSTFLSEYLPVIKNLAITYLPNIAFALFVLVGGWFVIHQINRFVRKAFEKGNVDPSLGPFLQTLINWTLKIILFITVISMLGVQATSFIAILGAAGLAVGLALQGTLSNFAGGVVLLILRPFKVGDIVDVLGYQGQVHEIQIFYTIILTFDKKTVYIPNGKLANNDMINVSAEANRRNEWKFGIAYGDDVDKAKAVLQTLINADSRILSEPEPFIALHSLGDSSINLVVRAWSKADDLWNVYFEMNEKVYKTFSKEGLNIPFPQMDVHLKKEK